MPKGIGHTPRLTRSMFALGAFLAVCMFIAAINGLLTAPAITVWYPTLVKPFFTPPNWLFAPVWFVLYLMIAIAGWRIWVWAGFGRGARALAVYAIQLLLNFGWVFLFFGVHAIGLGLVGIFALLAAIAWTMYEFARIDRVAALLLVPYAAWVAFAALLNGAIYFLN